DEFEQELAAMSAGDTELPLDDEEEPVYAGAGVSLGDELDAALNEPYAETTHVEEAPVEEYAEEAPVEDYAEEAPVEYAEEAPVEDLDEAPVEDLDEGPGEDYEDLPLDFEEEEPPVESEDEGYLAEEEPATTDFAAYPSYEEPEESFEEDVEEAPEPVAHHAPVEAPMAAMVGGHDSTDDFNLATLTQLVDEIRQESDRVSEMKESVARALALIQEMSESLKS
ncbi:MAG: hypothetical protein ACAI44_39460, partial [Candidatus Sericytochromatia bacterium]